MAVLNIRDVPNELMVKLKTDAVQAGTTLRAHVLAKLGWLENGPKISRTRAKADGVAVVTEATPTPKIKGKTCLHGMAKGYNCWQCGGLAKVGT